MFRFFRRKEENETNGTLAIGVGGAGCNIVNRLGKISAVDIMTVNTDRKGLVRSRSGKRILLGDGTIDAGCGGDIEKGRSLAEGASEEIRTSIGRYLNAVIMTGLGGGTGTGSVHTIARMAKRNGSRTIVFASLPMSFESGRRTAATGALDGIAEVSDILVVIDSEKLAELDPMLGARDAFSVLDQMMCESFLGLMEMLEGEEGEQIFRTLKGRMLTVSFAEGMRAEKVADALVNGLMMDAAVTSEPIIFIRGNIPPGGSRGLISERIEEGTGRSPKFVQGPDGHGMSLMMFAPVQ